MSDCISRADAIEAVRKELVCDGRHETHDKVCRFIADVLLPALPSAKGGDAEMNEVKPQYMQVSPSNGADLIRREDAIESVRLESAKRGLLGRGDILDILYSLPSAEAEWIPCSERLPEESGTYLTTTAKGSVCTDHFYANSNDICGRHWSYHRRREPIAWMPLPKPYREDGDDDGEE